MSGISGAFAGLCHISWGSIIPQQWAHINGFLDQPWQVHRLYQCIPESRVNYFCRNSFNLKPTPFVFFLDFHWIFFVLLLLTLLSLLEDILFNLCLSQAKTFVDLEMQITANRLRLIESCNSWILGEGLGLNPSYRILNFSISATAMVKTLAVLAQHVRFSVEHSLYRCCSLCRLLRLTATMLRCRFRGYSSSVQRAFVSYIVKTLESGDFHFHVFSWILWGFGSLLKVRNIPRRSEQRRQICTARCRKRFPKSMKVYSCVVCMVMVCPGLTLGTKHGT